MYTETGDVHVNVSDGASSVTVDLHFHAHDDSVAFTLQIPRCYVGLERWQVITVFDILES